LPGEVKANVNVFGPRMVVVVDGGFDCSLVVARESGQGTGNWGTTRRRSQMTEDARDGKESQWLLWSLELEQKPSFRCSALDAALET
jgi:hypothetical protein